MTSPIDFDQRVKFGDHAVEFIPGKSGEICQGGPITGPIQIDTFPIANLMFGGPMAVTELGIFLPIWQSPAFYPCWIDFYAGAIKCVDKQFSLWMPISASAKGIEFYYDLGLSKLDTIPVELFRRLRPISAGNS
jgi:hypothetical protein